jgi:hypothetical protein
MNFEIEIALIVAVNFLALNETWSGCNQAASFDVMTMTDHRSVIFKRKGLALTDFLAFDVEQPGGAVFRVGRADVASLLDRSTDSGPSAVVWEL